MGWLGNPGAFNKYCIRNGDKQHFIFIANRFEHTDIHLAHRMHLHQHNTIHLYIHTERTLEAGEST